jgi:hypothetical protein
LRGVPPRCACGTKSTANPSTRILQRRGCDGRWRRCLRRGESPAGGSISAAGTADPPDGNSAGADWKPPGFRLSQEPFAGYLCYRHADGEQEAAASHLGAIGAQTAELRARWQAYFRDLLLIRWPDAAFRTTSWARLRELGLGEPVDEIDFF